MKAKKSKSCHWCKRVYLIDNAQKRFSTEKFSSHKDWDYNMFCSRDCKYEDMKDCEEYENGQTY